MGTILTRPRKDGTLTYTAQIRVKRDGKKVVSISETFTREAAARAWMKRKEAELAKPGGLEANRRGTKTLADAIDAYLEVSRKKIGRTKAQVLAAIREDALAQLACDRVTAADIVAYAERLGASRKPQTVNNYLSHLGSVFAVAESAFGAPLSEQAMRDALRACKRLGLIAKSAERDRRPTLEELDRLMAHFVDRSRRRNALPMHRVIAFALYSSRRQEEITRILWADLEPGRILVRDMKNPGEKIGNHVWCDLVPEAEAIARAMPQLEARIFPYGTDAISAAFTRACKLLDIEDLHFHDLRHEAASRLFEMGWSIPRVATVTGHRSWQSLQRYSHLRQTGDKLAGWKWLELVS